MRFPVSLCTSEALGTIFGIQESFGVPQVGNLLTYRINKNELRLSVSGQYHKILTGGEWVRRIRGFDFEVSDEAEFVLTQNYIPCKRSETLFCVLQGETAAEIMAVAKREHYMEPHFATVCILRELFFEYRLRDCGLSALVVMHFPVMDSTGSLCQLALYRGDGREQGWLDVYYGNPRGEVEPGVGFVFFLP